MAHKKVVLKPGKEKAILSNRHPWIFSGAIASAPSFSDGDLMSVHSHAGDFLALAYFHSQNSIAGRIISFEKDSAEVALEKRLKNAFHLRKTLISPETNCYRLINAEADGLPGLIVDCYDKVLVMQINTCGMEKLKPLIIEKLAALFQPKTIYEKSISSARTLEGLGPIEGVVKGEDVDEVEVLENGIQFCVSLKDGQKTGLFLDQREMRKLIGSLAKDRKVLNCFSYTGGFSLYALKNGATQVTSVDIGSSACLYAEKNTELNGFDLKKHHVLKEDVFDYLNSRDVLDEDVVILDPPAFAKKRKDIEMASKGYKNLNFLAFKKAKPKSFLLTSSCSYFVEKALFQQLIFQAASEAKRNVRILQHHIAAMDHPLSLYHPEGDYLKSLLLYIE